MIAAVRLFLLVVLISSNTIIASAQSDQIERIWYNQEKTAKILVYKAKDNKFYGKIVWLKEPNENGKPKVDDDNPDPKKRSQPLMGLLVLKGFIKDGSKTYEDGTVYDPKNGKTYSCKITYNGNSLDVRGYVGVSMLGRTAKWTLAE